jgi:hypothetical protein
MNIVEKVIDNNILIDTNDTTNLNENAANDNTVANDTDANDNTDYNTNLERKTHNKLKLSDTLKRGPSCGLIIVDNFYNNAMDTRNYILTQEFSVKGNYPGQRTISYANEHLKEIIQKYVEPFGGKITKFPCPNEDNSDAATIYNGSFQYTTSRDRSWIHVDNWNNWAGIVFLTPNAPLTGGTAFYKFQDGAMCFQDGLILNNQEDVDKCSQDLTKWELVDRVGNVFNRLILFNAHRYHMSMDYFGNTKENGRLFQVFFFSTERN